MEFLKKTFKLAVTTGTTSDCYDDCRIIVPDLTATYSIKICLISEQSDMGFFNADTATTTTDFISDESVVVTGECKTRLSELRKYIITNTFSKQYKNNGNVDNDGVDYDNSTRNNVIYYIGGIRYNDIIVDNVTTTTFNYLALGNNDPSFIKCPIFKNPNNENIISNPKINNDVFIIRQELSVFENNYILENFKRITDILTYGGGKILKTYNNT
jgi:hypothetical protein